MPKVQTGKGFIFLAGTPILDFCNTELIHRESHKDFLRSKEDLRDWFGDLSRHYQLILPKLGFTESEYTDLIQLRQYLREYFQAAIDKNVSARKRAIQKINLAFCKIEFSKEVVIGPDADQVLDQIRDRSQAVRWQMAEWLGYFLDGVEMARIKKCENPNCSHFFYDTSKNASRQWCSMKSCGNVMKARAFQRRKFGQ